MYVFQLSTIDYAVIGVICISTSIAGLFFTLTRNKQNSFFEYFLASRSTHIVLIVLSYYATICPSAGFLGAPTELYLYGTQMFLARVVQFVGIFVTNAIFLPLLYQLNSPNVYKYLEIRYGTTISRIVIYLSIFQQLGLASINLFAIAVSLNSVTTVSMWVYVGIISAFVIPYSTFGGMRGIMLADSYQALIMIAVVFSIIIKSIMTSDGLSAIWQRNYDSGRIELFNFSVNPQLRYTFWTELSQFVSILHLSTMSQTIQQRILSASTMDNAKKAAIWATLLGGVLYTLMQSIGLFMYSYFYLCDPVQTGTLKSFNQLTIYYISQIFHNTPGMTGFFFAGLGCAFLSTYSSILNSFAAVFIDGVFQPLFPKLNNAQITMASKITVALFGLLTIGGVQLATNFPTMMQAYLSLTTITIGPVLFIFMIGVFCPQANSKLVFYSFITTLACMIWIVTGSMLVQVPTFTKPISTEGCPHLTNGTYLIQQIYHNLTTPVTSSMRASYFPLSTLSYQWYACFGFLITLLIFILFNLLFCHVSPPLSSANHSLIPDIVKKWHLKLNPKVRRVLLCDVYDEQSVEIEIEASTKLTNSKL